MRLELPGAGDQPELQELAASLVPPRGRTDQRQCFPLIQPPLIGPVFLGAEIMLAARHLGADLAGEVGQILEIPADSR